MFHTTQAKDNDDSEFRPNGFGVWQFLFVCCWKHNYEVIFIQLGHICKAKNKITKYSMHKNTTSTTMWCLVRNTTFCLISWGRGVFIIVLSIQPVQGAWLSVSCFTFQCYSHCKAISGNQLTKMKEWPPYKVHMQFAVWEKETEKGKSVGCEKFFKTDLHLNFFLHVDSWGFLLKNLRNNRFHKTSGVA